MGRMPTDYDEGVYLVLSQKMSWTIQDYSTSGTEIDSVLGKSVYSAPVFHHPPPGTICHQGFFFGF